MKATVPSPDQPKVMNHKKLCSDTNHKGRNPLPSSNFYSNQVYCKGCVKRRVYEQRAFKRSLGLKDDDPMPERFRAQGSYLERHERRRSEELAIAESFNQPIQEQFCFVERKPMFRGLADSFLRKGTKQSTWRAA